MNFQRNAGFRKTKKLFLIASEGAETEPRYFGELKRALAGRDAVIRMELVSGLPHQSKPKTVLSRLLKKAKEIGTKKNDELWLVIDRDAWTEKDLSEVCQEAAKNGCLVALSNPCFELWLFLHWKDYRPFNDGKACQKSLAEVCESYRTQGKQGYQTTPFLPKIGAATRRAESIDTAPSSPWPPAQGTRVYRLVKNLFSSCGTSPDSFTQLS